MTLQKALNTEHLYFEHIVTHVGMRLFTALRPSMQPAHINSLKRCDNSTQ